MTTRRKPSASLTRIINNIDEDKLRRTRDRMLVANKIADALNAKGISQKKFSEMTGRSESEVSEWLSGDRNFTIDTLSDIQQYLGIDLLNTSSMRTSPVSKEASRMKVAKRRTPVVYDMSDILIASVSNGWLCATQPELSVAL
uniref:helix-turn-helix domain-containing protein n=1 Tax=Candidatus Cryptobacteroides bacterium TaxID=3085639 RepID=UPI00402527CE